MGAGARKSCKISETVQDRTKVTITDLLEVVYALTIGAKINDIGRPSTAETPFLQKLDIFTEPARAVSTKIDPLYQRQNVGL